jgi:hypothetical protein
MCHPKAWVLAGMLGLTSQQDVGAWMQNKRALDLTTLGLKLRA